MHIDSIQDGKDCRFQLETNTKIRDGYQPTAGCLVGQSVISVIPICVLNLPLDILTQLISVPMVVLTIYNRLAPLSEKQLMHAKRNFDRNI